MILKSKKIHGRFIGQPISAQRLFSDLPIKTKKKLAFIRQSKEIQKRKTILEIGSFPQNFYVLRAGKAQIIIKNQLNQQTLTRLVEIKEIVGLTQFLGNSPNETKVVTLSTCYFDVFPCHEFLNLLKEENELGFRLAGILSLDLQISYKSFESTDFSADLKK
ncbi:MAG TPA: cyclic nucleotide-binding domain-containing protein [Pyrinomonadaceae bacterium]|nr:cyclic nucleotide-binding domain-containing protein [Pyrinomonadaceae bacterium]